ncbi:T9SS type A sorting domain-containing protein [Fluviicola chungangensis]|uniref:T9SS type A sorting domain-containing protein n=1 Tax=Fluviicola chungangensis TaxID=2597671 RepID=A0A556MN32_9FLAO|nr:T9SS type A sorting domain-containing protein [Fluviicola chungangensis]TSJ41351.1 T9SS type A sorting domain-containing protein [Fluviicola chungangensis]
MNGGSLSSGQRLLFELGASGTINNGTVTVGETIALVDGSTLASSKLIQNGGTITTNAEFGFENEAGVYYPTFEQTGGTLQINGSLVWLGAAPGAGKGYFRSTGGSVFVTGTIGNDPTSTMGMHLELNGSSTVLENSGPNVQLLSGDSLILADSATWKDLHSVNWMNDGVVYGTNTSFFQSGNTIFNGTTGLGTAVYQLGNLTVPAGKTFNHVYPAELGISGDMNIVGAFTHNSNQLILNGPVNQQVNHSSNNLIFHGLHIRNTANGPSDGGYGISLNTNISVSTTMELFDGIVVSAPGKLIKLADELYLTGQSDSTFIDGYVEKTGNDAFTFPLGLVPDRYRPLTITPPSSQNTQIKIGYLNTAYGSLTPVETPMQSVSALEYWDFTNSNPGDLVGVTLGWNHASESGLTDCADITMTVWNGTQWVFVPSGTSGLCSGANEGTLYSSGNLPVSGPITIGFTSNVTQQQVILCYGDSVTVGSNTYSASGTYFDLLQDSNGDDSTVVTVVSVMNPVINSIASNITSITVDAPTADNLVWINCLDGSLAGGSGSFTFTPDSNGTYAVIAEHNGCSDTSDCVIIDQLGLSELSKMNLEIYPNPVKYGDKLTVNAVADSYIIQTLDGKEILPELVSFANGKSEIQLPPLGSGIYLLKATGSSTSLIGRFKVD